jgi:hypothetical protein
MREIAGKVDSDAVRIAIGMMLGGRGSAYLADLEFDQPEVAEGAVAERPYHCPPFSIRSVSNSSSSLCLCVSVVIFFNSIVDHRDTEKMCSF